MSTVLKVVLGVTLLSGLPFISHAADELQSKDCGWCVITTPKVATTAVPFEVKFDLKGLTEKTKLNADLHYMKKDGTRGGFYVWGG